MTPRMRAALVDADALVTTWDGPRFGADLARIAPRLRVIGHCGGEVKARFAAPLFSRLTITNAPAPMAAPVAELAVTLLLHAVRNVDRYRAALRGRSNAIYARFHREGAGDETLRGRTIGLIGFGRIGRAVAALLAPFGPRLLVFDPYVPAREIRRAGAVPSGLRALLARSRDVVVAAALTERTRGLLDAAALARLRDGATVVNVARGGLIELPALTREVRSGRLRCALDVTDPDEPLPARRRTGNRLRGYAIVLPSPRCGGTRDGGRGGEALHRAGGGAGRDRDPRVRRSRPSGPIAGGHARLDRGSAGLSRAVRGASRRRGVDRVARRLRARARHAQRARARALRWCGRGMGPGQRVRGRRA